MFGAPAWWCFFERWLSIGSMPDDSHHGEGEHDEGDMAVPAMPGAGLVMIEAEFILGSLKTILNSPTMTFHRDQLCHRRALGTPSGEAGQITTGDVATDQEASCPFPGAGVVVLAGLEIGQFDVGPVVQTRPLGSFTGRQASPNGLGKALRNRGGGAADKLRLAPGMEHMIGGNAQNIAFAGIAKQRFDHSGARRNIAGGDLAFFSTWCPKGTPMAKLVAVEGHRWAIEAP